VLSAPIGFLLGLGGFEGGDDGVEAVLGRRIWSQAELSVGLGSGDEGRLVAAGLGGTGRNFGGVESRAGQAGVGEAVALRGTAAVALGGFGRGRLC